MNAKDLSKEPPRSPFQRIHDYVILARTIDKCRASLNNTLGDFHFNCPLDNLLFSFKGITGEEFRDYVKTGASDEEIVQWLETHGTSQTPGSISDWSRKMESIRPYEDPEKKEWFIGECKRLDLNPASTTLFEFLVADDQATFPQATRRAIDPNNWDLPMVKTEERGGKSTVKATVH